MIDEYDPRARQIAARIRRRLNRSVTAAAADSIIRPGAGDRVTYGVELDVEVLHDAHDLSAVRPTSPRRFVGGMVKRVKQPFFRILREVLAAQTRYNASNTRVVATLHDHSLEHAARINELQGSIERLNASTRASAEAVRVVGRKMRLLEAEREPVSRAALAEFDNLVLAEEFRGSRALIRERHSHYLARFNGRDALVDLGCGRGEFLELAREARIGAVGVDLDHEMIAHCRRLGLEVEQEDALTYLSSVEDESIGGAFAAQLIEHLEPPRLAELIRELQRTLRPGGVAIMESVNPQALLTYANFYLDLTHVRPYNPQLIELLFKTAGFGDTETEYLLSAESESIPALAMAEAEFNAGIDRVNQHLFGPQAYAVIATK
jgi:SAM-dependent methyltransferase